MPRAPFGGSHAIIQEPSRLAAAAHLAKRDDKSASPANWQSEREGNRDGLQKIETGARISRRRSDWQSALIELPVSLKARAWLLANQISAFPLAGSFCNSNPYSNSLPTVYLLCSANTLSADESTTQKCLRRVIRSNFNEINPSASASCLLDKQKTNIVRRSLIPPASNAPTAAPWHIFALMSSASLRRQITGWQKRTRLLAAESNSLTRERCAHACALPHFCAGQIKPASLFFLLLDIKSLTCVCFAGNFSH